MILRNGLMAVAAVGIIAASSLIGCNKDKASKIDMTFADSYDGKPVELVTFLDSVPLAADTIRDGRVSFTLKDGDVDLSRPQLAQLMVEGKVRGFVVLEPGVISVADSVAIGTGTPLNDRMLRLMAELDSVDNLDNMPLYIDFVGKKYVENRDNALGDYLGVEYIKFADIEKADSLLKDAPEYLRNSRKVKKYEESARLRAATSPGHQYTDFEVPMSNGNVQRLSDFVKPGAYTLVDFWASWCPYCIKELGAIHDLNNRFGSKGVNIVGVAVRDQEEDTRAAVEKYDIDWDVMYHAQRIPYDVYGFTGIPHHILIGPDGKIISRGESIAQIEERLTALGL